MSEQTNSRKFDHIRIIRADSGSDRGQSHFNAIALQHRALPEIDLKDIDPSAPFLGKSLSFPLLISSMTGGDHDMVRTINKNLALAAEATGVAMAVGSQRVMFTHPAARTSFALRPFAPTAVLIANLGAVQLNYGFGANECSDAIEVLQSRRTLPPSQSAPGSDPARGQHQFQRTRRQDRRASPASCPGRCCSRRSVSGFSPRDVELAIAQGIRYIDVAGSGGTSWSRIEHFRGRDKNNSGDDTEQPGLLFQDWGIPTPTVLQRLAPYSDRVTLIASGGIRSGIDMAKAMVLGASLCGMAKPFLEPALRSADDVIKLIERLRKEFLIALFLLGVTRIDDLKNNRSLLA